LIGTATAAKPYPKKTMNLGWLKDDTDDEDARRVVEHEFGHALGMVHEHQNPAAHINWNRQAVYDDLGGPPNNWTHAQVDSNVFFQYSEQQAAHTDFDVNSIMIYPIKASWTTDGFSCPRTTVISTDDKSGVAGWYPRGDFALAADGVALGVDSTSTYLLTLSQTLDRRRFSNGAWQPVERDFLGLGIVPFRAIKTLTASGGTVLFALSGGRPMMAAQQSGTSSWSNFQSVTDDEQWAMEHLRTSTYAGGNAYFTLTDGMLGAGSTDNDNWKYQWPLIGNVPLIDYGVVDTTNGTEIFAIPVDNPANIMNYRVDRDGTPSSQAIPAPAAATKLLGARILVSGTAPVPVWAGDMLMFDVNGAIWTCGLGLPVSSRNTNLRVLKLIGPLS
jgi:hypothetical protein